MEQTKTITVSPRKIIMYGCFIAAGILVSLIFTTSKTYTQLAIATLLYPPLVYLAFKYLPGRAKLTTQKLPAPSQPLNKPDKEAVEIVDIDKRTFLKMVGVAGLSYLVFSTLTKKTQEVLLGKSAAAEAAILKDTYGNKIDPAERQPTDGYKISEVDTAGVTFYGFINKDGGWYIMREDPEKGSFRYARGEANFLDSWKNRERLKYDFFNNVFY